MRANKAFGSGELTSSPMATIVHLRVNKYSHWTKWLGFFLPYMGMTAILVMFQVYGCNSFHRIIGPVNAYLRLSCHFFPSFGQMLHTKFRENRPTGSGEKEF